MIKVCLDMCVEGWIGGIHVIYAFVDVIPFGFACGKANQLLQDCHSQLLF